MQTEVISYTLTQEELEKFLSSKYGAKIEPVDAKQLAKLKSNQQRAKQFDKKKGIAMLKQEPL